MGLFRDIIDGINSLANYKKADAEQIKAKTQKDKIKQLRKENRELKTALSRNQLVGFIGIGVTIVAIFIGYFLIVYFPPIQVHK